MKKNIFLFGLIMAIASAAASQKTVEKNARPQKVYNGPSGHAIGAVLSSSNGKGLAYRYWPKRVGFHASFFPMANGDVNYYNGGITGYYTLRDYEVGRLFLHAGIEVQQISEDMNYTYYENGQPRNQGYDKVCNGFNIGAGPGLHLLQKYVSVDFFIGYGAYFKKWKNSFDLVPTPEDETVVTLTGGIAMWIEL